jgi:hypothetical protein
MIVSIDPGPHTGVVKYYPREEVYPETWDFATLDFTDYRQENYASLYGLLEAIMFDGDTVVCEKFEYQKEKAQEREHLNYEAAEYVGTVKTWYETMGTKIGRVGISLVMQSPSVAVGKTCFWTDDKLKALGLYQKTRTPHERSALRHLLYYVTFTLKDNQFLHRLRREANG